MRTLTAAAMAGFVAILVAGSAGAAPTVNLIWTGTTGTGTVGGGTIEALIGDTLTLDIVVNDEGGGIGVAALSVAWAPSTLTASNSLQCPSPPNVAPGTCNVGFVDFLSPLSGPPVPDNVAGFSGVYDPAKIGGTTSLGFSLTIGRIDFLVNSAGLLTVALDYSSGAEGIVDNANLQTKPIASGGIVTVIPEPATGGLLALGLGALAIIGRRRA